MRKNRLVVSSSSYSDFYTYKWFGGSPQTVTLRRKQYEEPVTRGYWGRIDKQFRLSLNQKRIPRTVLRVATPYFKWKAYKLATVNSNTK
jgi:hypothetical protein